MQGQNHAHNPNSPTKYALGHGIPRPSYVLLGQTSNASTGQQAAANDMGLCDYGRPADPQTPVQQPGIPCYDLTDPLAGYADEDTPAWASLPFPDSPSRQSYTMSSMSPQSGALMIQPEAAQGLTLPTLAQDTNVLSEWSSPYPRYQGLFQTSTEAKLYRQNASRYGRSPHIDPATDPTIDEVERMRPQNVQRIYSAMLNGTRARDNWNSTARKRWLQEASYSPGLIESCAHKIHDCLMYQVKHGFRGLATHDYCADERKGDDIDRDIDCAGRLENMINSLEQEKTICEDVMNSTCQIRMFVNAPRAYATRKAQNRAGNSKRSLKGDSPDSERKSKTRKSPAKNARARSSTILSTPPTIGTGMSGPSSDGFVGQQMQRVATPTRLMNEHCDSFVTPQVRTRMEDRPMAKLYNRGIPVGARCPLGPPRLCEAAERTATEIKAGIRKMSGTGRNNRAATASSSGSPSKQPCQVSPLATSDSNRQVGCSPLAPVAASRTTAQTGSMRSVPLVQDLVFQGRVENLQSLNEMLSEAPNTLGSPFQTPEHLAALRHGTSLLPQDSNFYAIPTTPTSDQYTTSPPLSHTYNIVASEQQIMRHDPEEPPAQRSRGLRTEYDPILGSDDFLFDLFTGGDFLEPGGQSIPIDPPLEYMDINSGADNTTEDMGYLPAENYNPDESFAFDEFLNLV